MRRTFHLIPHTHWDREWYLPRAAFLARLVPLLDDLLALLEREPAIRFHLDGQTVLIEDYCAVSQGGDRSSLLERLGSLVRGGRLGIGPWYVLADELIPSGESLVRNLLFGTADARRLGGFVPVLYSPDAFGHPEILPTLAGEFGLPYAVVWRGLGTPSGAERDLYRWRGPDGRSVLVYHLPREGYEIGSNLLGPEPGVADRWKRVRGLLVERAQSSHVAVPVGADHHAADPDLGQLAARLQALEPTDLVRLSSLAEFFAGVEQDAPALAEIAGELRWSYGYTWTLQGVAATRARQKRAHAIGELALARVAEPLGALAGIGPGGRSRAAVLSTAWRHLIQSQFHDTIAGTVDDRVAAEQAVRLESVRVVAAEVARASVAGLTGHDFDRARDHPGIQVPALVLWNPVARNRSPVVTAEISVFRRDVLVGPPSGRQPRTGAAFRPGHLRAVDGSVVPVQVLGVRPGVERIDAPRHYPDQDEVDRVFVAFRAPRLEGLSGTCLTAAAGHRPVPTLRAVRVRGASLGNDLVTLRVHPDGTADLTDRLSGVRYPGLFALRVEADRGDTYTPSIDPKGARSVIEALGAQPLAAGPFVGAIATRWAVEGSRGRLAGRTVVALHADSPIVRIRLDLDNGARDQRLRLVVPTGLRGPAVVGTQFGQVERAPVMPDRALVAERPVPTATAQRFAAARGDQAGLAIFAPGAFEYEWTERGELVVTLLRSVGVLSRPDLPERPGHAGWPVATPSAEEPGEHRIELAVAPGSAFRSPAELVRLWEDAFLEPVAFWFRDFVGGGRFPGGISLVGDDLSFEALKPAEDGDGLVLRAVNRSNRSGHGAWRLPWPIAGAARLRADESEVAAIEPGPAGREVEFRYGPREIVTIRVRPAGPP